MDWRFVLQMGALGLIMGVVNLMGWLPGLELPLWLGIGFVWVVTAARRVPDAAFQHVFLASLLAGFLSADVPALWFDRFLDNNPALANGTAPLTRTGVLLGGILWGGLFGLLTGGVAYLAARASRPRKPQEPAFGAHMDITHPGGEEEE